MAAIALPVSTRPGRRRTALLLLAVAVSLLLSSGPAYAHTTLEESVPQAGQELDDPLDSIELTFSRSVELLPDTFRIVAVDGTSVDRDIAVARSPDGVVVTGTLDEPLYAGAWEIHWRILASDSHPREGVIAFVVADGVATTEPVQGPTAAASAAPGNPAGPVASPTPAVDGSGGASTEAPVTTTTDEAGWPTSGVFELVGDLFRALFYLGLMVSVGLTLFKAGPHRGEESNAVGLARAVAVAAGVALVAGVVEVAAHAGALADRGVPGVLDGATWSAIMRTGLGDALLFRVAGLTVLLVGGLRRARRDVASGPDAMKILGAVLTVVSLQFVGHTASTAPEWAVRGADLVHVLAGAVWVGGLVGLAMLSGHRDRIGRARTAARFSSAAIVAVAAVAVAGTTMAYLTLPSADAVLGTTYGRLLVAKLAVVAALAAFGAYNHFRVVPRLSDGDTAALDDLRRTVATEVVLVVVVLVLTALLVNGTPR